MISHMYRTSPHSLYDTQMDAQFFVYILASERNGTLYIGVTNNLARRLTEHKAKVVPRIHSEIRSQPIGLF